QQSVATLPQLSHHFYREWDDHHGAPRQDLSHQFNMVTDDSQSCDRQYAQYVTPYRVSPAGQHVFVELKQIVDVLSWLLSSKPHDMC
ncbi:MAG: hypothetical protein ACKPKO_45725, partial [Candidatus Fonsibacter sp.]